MYTGTGCSGLHCTQETGIMLTSCVSARCYTAVLLQGWLGVCFLLGKKSVVRQVGGGRSGVSRSRGGCESAGPRIAHVCFLVLSLRFAPAPSGSPSTMISTGRLVGLHTSYLIIFSSDTISVLANEIVLFEFEKWTLVGFAVFR